jgi:hypothetical protein
MNGLRHAEVELGLELDVDDDFSLLELSLFLVSVLFDSLFDSDAADEAEDFELLSLFESDEEVDFEPLSLFDSPLDCPLRA